MKNILKTIFIPKDNAQQVTELESYTVKWQSAKHEIGNHLKYETHHKSFIKKEDATEFEKQLKECAIFLKTDIRTEMYKN